MTEPVTSDDVHGRAWRSTALFGVIVGLGIAAAVAMWAIAAFAPCDPNAPIMSFDSTREMAQPYGKASFWLNVVSPILLGVAAGVAWRRIRVGLLVWFVTGLSLYFIWVQIWKANCP